MNDKLESRIIRTGSNKRKKYEYKPQREYWSPELTRLERLFKQAEDEWCHCRPNSNTKMRLKHIFVQKRKLFDRTLQQAKRRYWIKL